MTREIEFLNPPELMKPVGFAHGAATRGGRTLYLAGQVAKDRDGKVVYRKGFVADGKAPALLTAYGSYGAPWDASFNSNRVSLLDRGFVYAVGHIRGGGDLGKAWHDQGRMLSKKNTFTDFVACAEHLVAAGWTSADRLIARGGSAGGMEDDAAGDGLGDM